MFKVTSDQPLSVVSGPHLHSDNSVWKVQGGTIAALSPLWAVSLIYFGWDAFRILCLATFFSVSLETLYRCAARQKIRIKDGSAFLIGSVLAFLLPPSIPWWLVLFGSFVAVVIGKEVLGGLGQNVLHPVLVADASLIILFPGFARSSEGSLANFAGAPEFLSTSSVVAIVLGGVFLIVTKRAHWETPLAFLIVVFGSAFAVGQIWMGELATGLIFFTAFFVLTDSVTSPMTRVGRLVFASGAGVLSVALNVWGSPESSLVFSVLLMNALVPVLDFAFRPR